MTSVLNMRGPIDYVDAWFKQSGYTKDRVFWLYVAHFIVDFMSEHGQNFNDNQRPSSESDRQHLIALFDEVIARL